MCHDSFLCVTWPNTGSILLFRSLCFSPTLRTLSLLYCIRSATDSPSLSKDWFWKLGWLIHKSALCTRIALLPHWGQNAYNVSTNSQLVRKIGSQNQSISLFLAWSLSFRARCKGSLCTYRIIYIQKGIQKYTECYCIIGIQKDTECYYVIHI